MATVTARAHERSNGQAQDHGTASDASSAMSITRLNRVASRRVVADHQKRAAAGLELAKEQLEKAVLAVGIQRRCRLVRDHQGRRADQRAGDGDALLLADAELDPHAPSASVGRQAERREQPLGLLPCIAYDAACGPARRRAGGPHCRQPGHRAAG